MGSVPHFDPRGDWDQWMAEHMPPDNELPPSLRRKRLKNSDAYRPADDQPSPEPSWWDGDPWP
jgi:hypothetical protein